MAEEQCTVSYREVPGFPEYRVGDDGSIWSRYQKKGKGRGNGGHWIIGDKWNKLKPCPNRGYLQTVIKRHDGKRFLVRVNRIVLLSFIGPCPDGMECCHENRDKSDNRLSNLRWGTKLANAEDKRRHGTMCRGETLGLSKLKNGDIPEIRERHANGETVASIAARFSMGRSAIASVIKRQTWKHIP